MSRPVGIDESAWGLLSEAITLYRDDRRITNRLRHQLSRFEGPLRIAVAGPWRSGKSTLVNAIVGDEVAPVEVEDGRQVFTWYEDGPKPRATVYGSGGPPRELAVTRSPGNGMRVDLEGWRPDQVKDLVVKWPMRTLRHLTLVDTPALRGSGDDGRTPQSDRVFRDADAVLYLTRDGRESDLRVLRSAQEGTVSQAGPVNVLLVLSRADELGGGQIDAFLTAKQIARRHRRDPQVSSVCLGVVALGGLVAAAGRLLTESDFSALATMAAVPRPQLEGALLSTDRFLGFEFPAPVPAEVRRGLLDRLGIFGVRLATTLIRSGCRTRASLSAELVRRSGLTELRESMSRSFIDRREVLKARSALVALELTLRAEPRPGTRELLTRLEHVLAAAHDFQELRLIAALRDGAIKFDAGLAAEAHRLAGGNGGAPAARLGVDHEATSAELWRLAVDALRVWQDRAEDPLLGLDQRRAARTVVRSCEGMLVQLSGDRR